MELIIIMVGFFVFGYSLGLDAGERRERRAQRERDSVALMPITCEVTK
jgi:hypothetical protein